jgi:aldehyde:ferredoxin oxidoreductase
MNGFFNQLLRINLTEKKASKEKIQDEVLLNNLGGKGLGGYLLLKELPQGVEPFSPDNKVIFALGPVSDTKIWSSSRYGVFTKSPLTGIFGESYAGGKVTPQMKACGYDAIILEGISKSPVYIEISDTEIKFHDASHIWGKETYETEDQIKKEVGIDAAQAIVIGPAGENLVLYALIENNYWRSAGRCGIGAVMGSKKVKGIVFHGKTKCKVFNPDMIIQFNKKIVQISQTMPSIAENYRKLGTPVQVTTTNTVGCFPTRYWSKGYFEKWQNLSADYMQEHFDIKSRACPNCFLSCGKLSTVKNGPYKGLTIEGPEFETIYALGGLNCLESLEEVAYINDLCDRLGMDTMTAGNVTAFAVEAYKRKKSDFEIDYGQAEKIVELLKLVAYQKGIGKIFAKGVRKAAKILGMEDIAVHVKGLEPAGFDPRVLKGMGLAYAVSSRGGCHLRGTFYKAELSGQIPPDAIEGKAELFVDYEDRSALFDCLIICRFFRDFIKWDELSTIIEVTAGVKLNKEELACIANHVTTQTRMFNIREGITYKDDTLPKRFFREPLEDSCKILREDELNQMVQEYYKLRGWDEKGRPQTH